MLMIEGMLNIFLLFYGALFGALLSAEIGKDHFTFERLRDIVPPRRWLPVWIMWAWTIWWLVVVRSVYFAWIYVTLPEFLKTTESWGGFFQVLALLLLCAPIFGIQQGSYLLVPPPPQTTWKTEPSWIVNTMVFGVAPAFALCLLNRIGA